MMDASLRRLSWRFRARLRIEATLRHKATTKRIVHLTPGGVKGQDLKCGHPSRS
jgi:hypothetical protein